ncbi:prephenate dehydrogenase (NADP+) [Rhizoctonia solani AG-1 IB]|uniref:Prephenate dehydrogenase (NADP+) n=1 Tax=Thanatephorus cucumeris (strain AG1-IB / isolate 7/3/14) TaxID=1108050 RepID=M5BPQ6_THACB|nr:prephenate dehydrogenase (NADP+) [Rhizoctonia solani AG-1 IB]
MRFDATPDAPIEDQPVIGIIGMGEMGKMYANILSAAGINVCDRPENFDRLTQDMKNVRGINVMRDGHRVSRTADWIMYAVEAQFMDKVVAEYGPSTKVGSIVGGQTSVKTPEKEAFEKYLPEDVHIVSCHSLHGPTVSPEGQPLGLYVRGIEIVKVNIMLRIYSNQWHVYAGLAILNPAARDMIKQYSASTTELFKLMLAGDIKGLREPATPLFRMWIGVAEYLFRSEERLDAAISAAVHNVSHRSDDLEFVVAARGWSQCVTFGSFELYKDRFQHTQSFFQPRFAEATAIGSKMIKTILDNVPPTPSE